MGDAVLENRRGDMPLTLGQIITRHRDLCSLRLSTDEELDEMQKAIIADAPDATHVIQEWRVICIDRAPENGDKAHLLLGDLVVPRTVINTPCSSSPLLAIDLGGSWAASASGSLYRLVGNKRLDDPPQSHVLQLCSALCRWRVGKFLGVFDPSSLSAQSTDFLTHHHEQSGAPAI